MGRSGWALVAGIAMLVGGLALFFTFRDIETPVVGLRQAGVVIAVLGVIEIVTVGWSMIRPRRTQD